MQATAATLATSLLPFAISMSFTPGPNNLMVANSGMRFGLRRTVPQIAGVVTGFALLNLVVGLGVSGLISAAPGLFGVMKIASIAYLLYLAWRIATAEGLKTTDKVAKPIPFLHAVAFQWVNPKAWMMAVGAVATYTSLAFDLRLQVLIIVLVFAVVGVASTATWTLFGQLIRRYLTTPRKRIAFNWIMAGLLLASIAPVLVEHG